MKSLDYEIAVLFAKRLDNNQFSEAKELLAEECTYELGTTRLSGRDAILNSYEMNYRAGKNFFDEIIFTSEISEVPESLHLFDILYTDRIRIETTWHTYQCVQRVEVRSGSVFSIVHRELPGERERLEIFKKSKTP